MNFRCPFCQSIVSVDNSDCGINVQCGQCGEITTSPTSRVSSGVVIGSDFIILEEIGRGGMGVVFLAHQISLDRPTALKILAPKYANNSEFIAGFIKEARAAAKLNHPHIVQAYAVGEEDGIYYFAMEFVDGETMKTVLRRENIVPLDRALVIIQQVAEALDSAWKEQQLIHRDIKPDNIMIARNGRSKLADLGLAKFAGEIDDADKDEVMGTPQYISPEHLTGMTMDIRSDIYSLGATFFHLVTGRFAFTGKDAVEIARKHIESPLDNPRSVTPSIPDSVSAIIMKMMEKNPDNRYQSAEELAEDIRLVRRGKSPSIAFSRSTGGGGGMQMRKPGVSGRTQAGKMLVMNTTRTPSKVDLKSPMLSSGIGTGTRTGLHPSMSVSTTATLRKIKEKKAKRQVVLVIVLIALCVMVAGAIMAWISMSKQDDRKKPVKKHVAAKSKPEQKTPEIPKQEKVNVPVSDFEKKIEAIVQMAKVQPVDKTQILKSCDDFLQNGAEAGTDAEKNALASFNEIYIPLDEERIAVVRQNIKKQRADELEKIKQEEEARRKEDEAKRKEEAKLLAVEMQKKEAEEKEAKRLQDYRDELAKQKESIIYRCLLGCAKKEFDEAGKLFDTAVQERTKVSDARLADAQKYSEWASRMQIAVGNAKKFYGKLINSDTLLAGWPMEVKINQKDKRDYGTVVKIINGEITIKNASNQLVKVPLEEQPFKIFGKVVKKFSSVMSMDEMAFDYLVMTGEFELAREFATTEDYKNLLSDTAYNYIKQCLIYSKDDIKNLKAKYGKLEEFNKAAVEMRAGGQ